MNADDLARFARQISLPEIGVAGQAKLAHARLSVAGLDPRVARWATEHAERAGAAVGDGTPASFDDVSFDVAAIAGRPELEDCAACLLGALAALDLVRQTVLDSAAPTRPIPLV